MGNTEVSQLVRLTDYREQRTHLFPSPSSLDWFVRGHKAELVQAGALLLVTGRWVANPGRFDAYLLEAGGKAAQKHSGA